MSDGNNITELLAAWHKGDRSVEEDLLRMVLPELRKIVHNALYRPEASGLQLQTTEMVSELYIRLARASEKTNYKDRKHFYALCARQIRQILVDLYREKAAQKRGGGVDDLVLDPALIPVGDKGLSIVQLHDALADLEKIDPEKARIVEQRVFVGLSNEEIAQLEEISAPTVKRRWKMAKALLLQQLKSSTE